MLQVKLLAFATAISLLLLQVKAQQSCINICTGSANVLTQLKTCTGCATNDFACFCRCPQYTDALLSCAQQECSGITDDIVSFCASQGVTLPYTSTSLTSSTDSSFATSSTSSGSDATSSTTDPSSQTSFTATDTSDILAYLSSAVPSNAETESSAACFVNTPYSYYSTPTWYSTLPTQVQTYYSSVNQGNTAACTLSPAQVAAVAEPNNGGSGLSGGAIAGIVIGAIIAALLLAALLWCCLRRRRRARRSGAMARSAKSENFEPRTASYGQARSQTPHWNEKGGPTGSAANTSNHMPPTMGRAGYGPGNGNNMSPTPGVAAYGPYGANHMPPVAGGAVYGGNNNNNQPMTQTMTTTTRTVIRPRQKNPAYASPPNPISRPPPQPISDHAYSGQNNAPQNTSQQLSGRRAF